MTLFTLHQGQDRLAAPVLIAHRFSWTAFLFGPLWLAARRLWLAAALVFLIDGAAIFLAVNGLLNVGAAVSILFVAAMLTGLEAPEWRRRAALRRGRAITGVAQGADEVDALGRLAGAAYGPTEVSR